MPRIARVLAVTGSADSNTFPELARDYVATLVRRGVTARFIPVRRGDHNDVVRAGEVRVAVGELLAIPLD